MKILYPNLDTLNVRCKGKNNSKEQCRCISVVVSSKKKSGVKWLENNVEDIIVIFNAY